MKRLLLASVLLLAAAVLASPASAAPLAWKGVVIAKDPQRKAVVTTSADGTVRTLRVAPAKLRSLKVGQRLQVRADRLADGTFQATSARASGSAKTARVRAVLVRHERAARRYLVSAGGSVFALGTGRGTRALASSHEPGPGDKIDANVTVQSGGIVSTSVQTAGSVGVLELEGIVTELAPGSLKLVVARAGFVTVAVPQGFSLPPTLRAFDAVQLVVSVGADGSFTLVSVQAGDGKANRDGGIRFDHDGEELEVKGSITALDAASITVQPGAGASPATCAVPVGAALTGFAVGDEVEMECLALAGGQFLLVELESKRAEFEAEERRLRAAGAITALSATSITVQPESGAAVTCSIPAGATLVGLAVGDRVKIECVALAGSAPILRKVKALDDDDDEDTDDTDDTTDDTDDEDSDDDDTDD